MLKSSTDCRYSALCEASHTSPPNPRFWLLIGFNVLSSAISFILRTYRLPASMTLVLAGYAIANFVIGIRIALHLTADKAAAPPSTHHQIYSICRRR